MSIKIGTVVKVKVGKNLIEVELLEVLDNGFRVKSLSTNKEFKVKKLETIASHKKQSLLNVAINVLQTTKVPMNTREIITFAIANKLWMPTGKTPEQTLYSSIIREIATKENPRIIKSTQKGKFVIAISTVTVDMKS